jgi:hypothetical protein
MIAEETAVATADAAADGVDAGEEGARAEDARKAVPAADAIFRLQNTPRHRVVNLVATTIVARNLAGTTAGDRMLRAVQARSLPLSPPRSRLSFPANLSPSIAASPQLLLHLHRWPSMTFKNCSPR